MKCGLGVLSLETEAAGRPVDTTAQQDRRLYRFGLFEADLGQGTLNRQGTPVKLQEQPFRILALLLETSGEVLSREELRKRIWPEGTFVEFDGSLNTALMKLRSALNDNAENPVFIETVPRRGYRFIAPVEIMELEASPLMTAIRIETEDDREAVELPLDGDRPVEETKPKQFKWSDRKAGPALWQVVSVAAGLSWGRSGFF